MEWVTWNTRERNSAKHDLLLLDFRTPRWIEAEEKLEGTAHRLLTIPWCLLPKGACFGKASKSGWEKIHSKCTMMWIPWLITESWFRWLFVHIFLNIRTKFDATDSTFIDTDTSTGVSLWDLSLSAKSNVDYKIYSSKWLQSIHYSVTRNHTSPMSFPSKSIAPYFFNSPELLYRFSSPNESCRRVFVNSSISLAFTWSKLVLCNLCKQEYALSCKWGTTTTEHTIYLLNEWENESRSFLNTIMQRNKKPFCKSLCVW